MDEAWQILHHLRAIENPLSTKSGLFEYLLSSRRSYLARGVEADRAQGQISFRQLDTRLVWLMVFYQGLVVGTFGFFAFQAITSDAGVDAFFFFFPLVVGGMLFVVTLNLVGGRSLLSAQASPGRWMARHAGALVAIPSQIVSYLVRGRAWLVVQQLAMGLDGYAHKLPTVGQQPSYAPADFIKYENLPSAAEERAVARRDEWIGRYFGSITGVFANVVVTASDMETLLKMVANDLSLVHAAYYTDDECIDRIARWIAGKG